MKVCPHFYEYEDWPKNIPMCRKTEEENNRNKKCEHKHNYLNCPIYKWSPNDRQTD